MHVSTDTQKEGVGWSIGRSVGRSATINLRAMCNIHNHEGLHDHSPRERINNALTHTQSVKLPLTNAVYTPHKYVPYK